jgi:hypothetical protein
MTMGVRTGLLAAAIALAAPPASAQAPRPVVTVAVQGLIPTCDEADSGDSLLGADRIR